MHDLRSIRLVCAPPHKSYDLRGGFSAPSPCRTNDTAFQHLRRGGSPRGNARLGSDSSLRRRLEKPPRAPLRLCHITPLPLTHYKTATTPQAEAYGVASAYPRSIASEAGLAPSGSPAALSHNSAATDSLQNSDNPAGRSLRVASAYPRSIPSEAGLAPRAPCGSISSPSRHGCSTGSDNPAGRSLRGCLSMTPQTRRSIF